MVLVKNKFRAIFLCLLFVYSGLSAQKNKVKLQNGDQINWSSFMAKQSLKWDSLSTDYYSGILLGNGLLGANIYKENDQSIRVDIGRTDVVDQRAKLYPNVSMLYNSGRLPIGFFSLATKGKIIRSKIELDIYNAEAKGSVITDKGSVEFLAFVPTGQNVVYIEMSKTGDESIPALKWNPGKSISPRYFRNMGDKPKDYPENPAPQISNKENYTVCNQPMLNGGGYTTAYKSTTDAKGLKLVVSVGYDKFSGKDETTEAINYLKAFEKKKVNLVINEHTNWWHKFYQKSFISLPDKRLENFYWIQLYKFASATRADKPMLDLQGPWTTSTNWPAIWWNLNAQLAYSPIYTANHLELGESLFTALDKNIQTLINNVPEKWRYDSAVIGRSSSYDLNRPITEKEIAAGTTETANLTWAVYQYYQYYAYSGDTDRLKTKIYPLLKRATNFIIHLLEKDEKGVYHVINTYSPEYKSAVDANYALASLRWGITTILKTNKDLGLKDADEAKYKEILANLTPYPANADGYLIGKDVPLSSTHRHYSHLMMIHPYYLVNWDQKENHDIMEKSVTHWQSMKEGLAGFSFTGSASMYASMDQADKAYEQIDALMRRFVQPNTLYSEGAPVIESSLAAATSTEELLLQSWGDKIRVFPAIPSTWKNVAFKDLRAEGAFLVTAVYKDGKTQKVEVKSLKGGFCKLSLLNGKYSVKMLPTKTNKDKVFDIIESKDGNRNIIGFDTKPNDTFIITQTEEADFPKNGVDYSINPNWSWGLNKNNTNRNAN